MPTKRNIDCIIIGAGPAGLSAAIQAKRQGLSVAVFEKGRPGGQALAANLIENFPGFPEGISGTALMERFLKQAKAHGVEIEKREVKQITDSDAEYRMITDSEGRRCRSVIVACGLKPKHLNVPGEKELIARKIHYYADPLAVRHNGKDILVIGSGDAAFDQAINFSKKAKSVSILMRSEKPCCIQKLYGITLRSKIAIIKNAQVKSFGELNDKLIVNIKYKKPVVTDMAIVCIGKEKTNSFIDCKSSDGVFFAGDCVREKHRHIAIAVGDGTLAAMKAADYINGTK